MSSSDKQIYSPQEEGSLKLPSPIRRQKVIATRRRITDAAVYYIREYAPDISNILRRQTSACDPDQASFYQRPYVRLVRTENNEIITMKNWTAKSLASGQGYPVVNRIC